MTAAEIIVEELCERFESLLKFPPFVARRPARLFRERNIFALSALHLGRRSGRDSGG
jgi:hypothetical protein